MMCRQEIVREGSHEVACFTDAANGRDSASPWYGRAPGTIEDGGIDIVYADAMDRLSRSQADIAMLFERLRFVPSL